MTRHRAAGGRWHTSRNFLKHVAVASRSLANRRPREPQPAEWIDKVAETGSIDPINYASNYYMALGAMCMRRTQAWAGGPWVRWQGR